MPRNATVDVSSIDGSISAKNLAGVLDFASGDGALALDNIDGNLQAWQIRTSDGSVALSVPADLAADIDLHTSDAHLTTNIPLAVEENFDT